MLHTFERGAPLKGGTVPLFGRELGAWRVLPASLLRLGLTSSNPTGRTLSIVTLRTNWRHSRGCWTVNQLLPLIPAALCGEAVQGAVAQDGSVEEAEPLVHGPVAGADASGSPVPIEVQLVQVGGPLHCRWPRRPPAHIPGGTGAGGRVAPPPTPDSSFRRLPRGRSRLPEASC